MRIQAAADDGLGVLLRRIVLFHLLLWLRATPASAEPFERWTDDVLVNRATLAFEQGDCFWALQAFRTLLNRSLAPSNHVRALYYQGVCLERSGLWEDAAFSYQEMLDRFAEADIAPEASYRLAVLYTRLNRLRDSLQQFESTRKTYRRTLPANDDRLLQAQIAFLLARLGKSHAALHRLNQLFHSWQGQSEEENGLERQAIAIGYVARGYLLWTHSAQISFDSQRFPNVHEFYWARAPKRRETFVSERLEELRQRIVASAIQFDRAVQTGSPEWTSAAMYFRGQLLEAFYIRLLTLPPPPYLTPSQQVQFRRLLSSQFRHILVDAGQSYLRGYDLAMAQGDTSHYVGFLRAKVALIDKAGIDGLLPPEAKIASHGIQVAEIEANFHITRSNVAKHVSFSQAIPVPMPW